MLIHGKVYTEKKGPLPQCNIKLVETDIGTTTDETGAYSVSTSLNLKSIKLHFSHVGYYDTIINAERGYFHNDSILINLILRERIILLPEFTIDESEFFFSRSSTGIRDILFYQDNLFILASQGNSSEVIVLDTEGQVLSSYEFRWKFMSLFIDCFNNLHLVGDISCLQISYNEEISIVDEYSRTAFDNYLFPCIAASDRFILFSNRTSETKENYYQKNHNQYKQLFTVRKSDHSSKIVYESYDITAFDVSQQYYREIISLYNQSVPETENIFAIGMWDGNMIKLLCGNPDVNSLIYWYLKIESRPIFCPSYIVNDTVYTFDFVNDRLIQYDSSYGIKDSLKIDFHLTNNWEEKLLKDEKTQGLYAVYHEGASLSISKINVHNGNISGSIKPCRLPYPAIIKLFDGYSYSVYNGGNIARIDKIKL